MAISILIAAFGFNLIELKLKYGSLKKIKVDWVNNLCLGMIERLLALFFFYPFMEFLSPLYGDPLFEMGKSGLTFIIGFILVDFAWYWFHFLAHKWNWLWLVHKAHHAPKSMDFSVAFVNHPIGTFLRGFIYLGIAKIGVPIEFVITAVYLKAFYQYFQHTELWNEIPVLSYVFVMPAHHRVHHSQNEIHLDKNFGGVFIFWDKLFGTYAKPAKNIQFGLKGEEMPLSVIASLLGGVLPRFVPRVFSYVPKTTLSISRVLYLFMLFIFGFCSLLFIPSLKEVAIPVTVLSVTFLAMGNVVTLKKSTRS